MNLERNVGGWDRLLRGTLGLVLLVSGAAAFAFGQAALGVAGLVVAGAFLFNAVTQFCGVNALLGIDTCSVGHGDGD